MVIFCIFNSIKGIPTPTHLATPLSWLILTPPPNLFGLYFPPPQPIRPVLAHRSPQQVVWSG